MFTQHTLCLPESRLETAELTDRVEAVRRMLSHQFDRGRRTELGQFLTPAPVASLMASLLDCSAPTISILDPGAGIGTLSATLVHQLTRRSVRPQAVKVTAFEIDNELIPYLRTTLEWCRLECMRVGITFTAKVIQSDFINDASRFLHGDLFSSHLHEQFSCAILNPPYGKINSSSYSRSLLRKLGIETTNLYTGFMALCILLLQHSGEIVAITPRSFCNGSYFLPFRRFFLSSVGLCRLHLFESRQDVFHDDNVLQENIITYAVKGIGQPSHVVVSTSRGADVSKLEKLSVPYYEVVHSDDAHLFIRIPDSSKSDAVARIKSLPSSLEELGLTVSTGRVVDFRAKAFLRRQPDSETAPLIYPMHLHRGRVVWPRLGTKKPNALISDPTTRPLLIPRGNYVLVKRFSSKEEKRRVVAAVYNAEEMPYDLIGIENHVNYFHHSGAGIDLDIAMGLAVFLNSTVVDSYFRQLSGHTQVNATDLRTLRYPSTTQLRRLGATIRSGFPPQEVLDRTIEEELWP